MENKQHRYRVAHQQHLFNVPRILLALMLMCIHGLIAWQSGAHLMARYHQQQSIPRFLNSYTFIQLMLFGVMVSLPVWAIYLDIQKFQSNHLIPTKRVNFWYNLYFMLAAIEIGMIFIPLIIVGVMNSI